MKRPRSHDEDPDEGDRAPAFKDWDRSLSHRRFYPKPDVVDDRPPRRRYDFQDPDAYDRRRYRDAQLSSSPRSGSYSSDRLHRSESFSVLRREFPKGFRSERERSRREVSSGSSWRRSGSGREREGGAADELRSPSISSDLAARGSRGASVEDRGKGRSRDSSSREQSRKAEASRVEKSSSSEREEGELEPDPEPQLVKPPVPPEEPDKCCEGGVVEGNATSKANMENKEILSPKKGASSGRDEGRSLQMAVDDVRANDKLLVVHVSPVKELNEMDDEEVGGSVGGNEQEIVEEECSSLASRGMEASGRSDSEERASKEGKCVALPAPPSPPAKLIDRDGEDVAGVQAKEETVKGEETGMNLEVEQKEGSDTAGFQSLCNEAVVGGNCDGNDSILMSVRLKDNHRDKGKSLAISLSGKSGSIEDDNLMEGTSGRGFELVFRSDGSNDAAPVEQSQCTGIVNGKLKDEKPKLEPLDLSLGLPGIVLDTDSKLPDPNHNSTSHARSVQSLPSSFRTISDGFTNSISFSSSQPLAHNPSCSLTQNSKDNYEHSVGSHPIFQGGELVSNGTLWQDQTSNEPKCKGGRGTLIQRVLMNGNSAHNSLIASNGQHLPKPDALSRQSSLPRQLSPANSHGSHDTRSENSKDKRLLAREISSSSLFRNKQRDREQLVLNGVGVVERIISKVVSEPLQVMSRMLHEMTEHSVAYLRESIREMVVSVDKHGQVHALREAIERRSDLTMETISKCPRVLLEILVALKTGLPDYLRKTDTIPSSDLVDIFLNLRCRNPTCRSNLPVDDCDCRICIQKNGFCRECMCMVCSKFDMASNTCSWVGCDVCLHWCHTDCGLQESHIRVGRSASGTQGMTEMQFHCIACDHPSEMFGFVKEVFKTCAKSWKIETLANELQYVRRIFSASSDMRGKRLCDMANQMMVKLEDKANQSEVINCIMAFLCESESKISSGPSALPSKEPCKKNLEGSIMVACSSKRAAWLPSVSSDKVSRLENSAWLPSVSSDKVSRLENAAWLPSDSSDKLSHVENLGILSKMGHDRVGMRNRDSELHMNIEKKPVIDELESVVMFKQAEAKMYQEHADDARREAEGLKHIAVAKNVRIEEEYATRIAKLRLGEAEERRRQKLGELQVIERAHHEYFNMKMKMEADIKKLLLKMEATKHNFST